MKKHMNFAKKDGSRILLLIPVMSYQPYKGWVTQGHRWVEGFWGPDMSVTKSHWRHWLGSRKRHSTDDGFEPLYWSPLPQ